LTPNGGTPQLQERIMELEREQQWVYYRNLNIGHIIIRPEIESYALRNTYVSRTRLS